MEYFSDSGEYAAPEIAVVDIRYPGVLCMSEPDTTETIPGGFI